MLRFHYYIRLSIRRIDTPHIPPNSVDVYLFRPTVLEKPKQPLSGPQNKTTHEGFCLVRERKEIYR